MSKHLHCHYRVGKSCLGDSIRTSVQRSGFSSGDLEDRRERPEDREAVEGGPESR